jgi:GT2 family glycosyltransferase
MSLRVVAVVISNDQPSYLENCLVAIERQSFRPERVLVVDSSTNQDVQNILEAFVKTSSKHAVINIEERANFAELAAIGIKQVLSGYAEIDDIAIWLIHDDSAPEIHALAELVRTLELSPMVGIASPKQLSFDNPKLIVQQGLTLTQTLKPFSIVNDELDQKQHDGMNDVLAVSTNAMLIRAKLWSELGGFSLSAPLLAQDIELGIRAHQLGFRVVVVPTARVRHAELAVNNKRGKAWLGGSSKYALTKATNHLRISQLPLFVAFLYWLTLPITSIIQIFWLMFVKRPNRIWYTLKANLWAFITFRARLRDRHKISLKSVRALFATDAQVRSRSRLAIETAEQKINLTNFADQSPKNTVIKQLSFVASGGLWIMLGLAIISYRFFPLGQAAYGGFALPLSDNWLQLFTNTGSSYQHVGLGLAAPSDPFSWVLLVIGSLTFFAPNLALSWVLLVAKSLAFFGAWRFISTMTARNSIKISLALVYALWPSFSISQSQGNFPAVLFAISLPWLLFSLLRAYRIGLASSVRSSEQTWSWLAASALLLAITFACAPSSVFLLLIIGLAFTVIARKKLITLLVIPIPTMVLAIPYVWFQVIGNAHPVGILADPSISFQLAQPDLLGSLIGDNRLVGWCALGIAGLALFALFAKIRIAFLLWLFALLALVNLWFISSIGFTFGGVGSIFLASGTWVYDSPTASLMFFALAVLSLIALWLDSMTRGSFRKAITAILFVLIVLPLGYLSIATPTLIGFADSRNLPAIFTAEANAGSGLRMLVLSNDGAGNNQSFSAEVITPSGIKLDTISSAYRLSTANQEAKTTIANLVANLVSANGKSIAKDLKDLHIGYLLVPKRPGNGDVQVSLNSAAELDQVGTTEFGQLWRVRAANPLIEDETKSMWSITKTIQLSVLVGFILLALPTSRGRKVRASNEFSEFEEVEE